MSSVSINILILHAAIMGITLVLGLFFRSQHKSVLGVYFVLMPVGYAFFMDVDPFLAASIVLVGLTIILYNAHKSASGK